MLYKIHHWLVDAPETLRIRLQYAHLLKTPKLAKKRFMYLWGSPLVAAWATAKTFANPQSIKSYWSTMPLVYLTKLIWCWSAYKHFREVILPEK